MFYNVYINLFKRKGYWILLFILGSKEMQLSR